jgi:hypothetical protein
MNTYAPFAQRARELEERLTSEDGTPLFQPLREGLHPIVFTITEIRRLHRMPEGDFAVDADLHYWRAQDREYVNMADFWSTVCDVLERDAHPGQKAKILFEYDCTIGRYYGKNIPREQAAFWRDMERLRRDLSNAATTAEHVLVYPKGCTGPVRDEKAILRILQAIENKFFLDTECCYKLYQFLVENTPKFKHPEGWHDPFPVVLRGFKIEYTG